MGNHVAQVPERVPTKSFVDLSIENSKSNHIGAQGTFKGSGFGVTGYPKARGNPSYQVPIQWSFCAPREEGSGDGVEPNLRVLFFCKLVNKRSDTYLGNAQSAPRGGERTTVC